ncbi:hypothetical protein AXG93_3756s1360 [Marchantia polymorpha subsp. ruderalis]|uniref:Uncharacterized protein n=1 Tax=Marchantia polymorpha subsp. ruderalis TaxID=1480154 RepID=A0A176VFJ5_MARPO|nr:hypothetical protein AXG93_3756s1360 [Marchantia polymorpha subsp. ruderalis]
MTELARFCSSKGDIREANSSSGIMAVQSKGKSSLLAEENKATASGTSPTFTTEPIGGFFRNFSVPKKIFFCMKFSLMARMMMTFSPTEEAEVFPHGKNDDDLFFYRRSSRPSASFGLFCIWAQLSSALLTIVSRHG